MSRIYLLERVNEDRENGRWREGKRIIWTRRGSRTYILFDRAKVGRGREQVTAGSRARSIFPRGPPVWKKEKRPTSSTDRSSRARR